MDESQIAYAEQLRDNIGQVHQEYKHFYNIAE